VSTFDVHCPSCRARVPAAGVNVARMVAKCDDCDVLFEIPPRGARGARSGRLPAPVPRGIQVDREASVLPDGYRSGAGPRGRLVITRRWFRAQHVASLAFAIVWDGILVSWYVVGIASGAPLVMLAFPLLHVAVGVWVTYSALAGLCNKTLIRVDDGVLSVHHGPLPWRGNQRLAIATLHQLYTVQNPGKVPTYSLLAITADTTAVPVVSKLPDVQQALFIERELERFLDIEDERVPGAVRNDS
jgi:hypothetical protein